MLFFPPVFRSVFVGIFFTALYYKTIIYVQLKCSTYLIQFDSLYTFTKKTSNHKRGSYVITSLQLMKKSVPFHVITLHFFYTCTITCICNEKYCLFLHIFARCSGFMWHFSYIYLPIFSDILFPAQPHLCVKTIDRTVSVWRFFGIGVALFIIIIIRYSPFKECNLSISE